MTGLVVVNYNDYINTKKFIKSILGYKIISYIAIVDNCSTDNSYTELEKIVSDRVILLSNDSNKGYGSGINLGSKYLMEKCGVSNIIVSNTDIIINSEDDLIELISYLKDDIALIGPVVVENGGVNRGWKIPSIWDDVLLNFPVIHRRIRKKILFYKDECYNDKTTVVEALSGCFFIIRADVLKQVDFFDENIFLYYEENVLAVKLKKAGFKSIIVNGINVVHNHSVTIDNSINRIKKYKILKKSQKYFHKNYSHFSLFGIISLYITDKIMLILLYFVVFFKGGKK
jgi:hypothetical protein